MTSLRLGSKNIENAGREVYIIAEIGQNHQGSLNVAKQMIIEAKKAGCDCVKFQKSCLSAKFTQSALNRAYVGENSWGKTYGEHKEHIEFSMEQYLELQQFCRERGIDFTASAMDELSLQALDDLDVPFIKIGSGDANNFPMLKKCAMLKRPLVISTGMQTLKTILQIKHIMEEAGKTNFALLHCVSAYPTEPADCNLQMITFLKQNFPKTIIGYSGHEEGIEISKAAVLLGARIVERHITLDKGQRGSDHKCSLEPNDLQQLVAGIVHCDSIMGSLLRVDQILHLLGDSPALKLALKQVGKKVILACELPCKQKLGKSLVAASKLKKDHKLQIEDISIKVSEPNGVPAEFYYDVLGRILKGDIEPDQPILYEHIEDCEYENKVLASVTTNLAI